jgi:hypothetical protein
MPEDLCRKKNVDHSKTHASTAKIIIWTLLAVGNHNGVKFHQNDVLLVRKTE